MAGEWLYTLEYGTESFELEERELSVGRSRRCDLVVQEPSVSRRHASLTPEGGKILVCDLGSSNGTFVNGRRLKAPSELGDGDTLKLGDAELHASVRRLGPDPLTGGPETPREVGEATHFLQSASVRLAQEALSETSERSTPEIGPAAAAPPLGEPPRPDVSLPEGSAPGTHVAPPRPAAELEVPDAAEPPPPSRPADPLATTAMPASELLDLAAAPAGTREDPPELNPLATEAMSAQKLAELAIQASEAGSENPLATTAMPVVENPTENAEPPQALEASPLATTAMPVEELMAAAAAAGFEELKGTAPGERGAAPPEPAEAMADERTADEPEAGVPRVEPPPVEPPPVESQPPGPALEDVRAATAPAKDGAGADENASGDGELLSSLEGFDLTLGPGVPVPEAMERAREKVEQKEERAPTTEGVRVEDLYRPPDATPPLASLPLRALAALLDGVWIGALAAAATILGGAAWQVAAGVLGLLIVLLGWALPGTTPGKWVLQLYVYAGGRAGIGLPRALLRLLGYVLSAALLGLGFLLALSSSRQALHDRIAGTHVRRRS